LGIENYTNAFQIVALDFKVAILYMGTSS